MSSTPAPPAHACNAGQLLAHMCAHACPLTGVPQQPHILVCRNVAGREVAGHVAHSGRHVRQLPACRCAAHAPHGGSEGSGGASRPLRQQHNQLGIAWRRPKLHADKHPLQPFQGLKPAGGLTGVEALPEIEGGPGQKCGCLRRCQAVLDEIACGAGHVHSVYQVVQSTLQACPAAAAAVLPSCCGQTTSKLLVPPAS